MNIKKSIVLFSIFICFSITAQAAEEKPSVSFNIVVEKEVEASCLILKLKIEKKDKDFKTGSAEVSKALDKLIASLKKAGLSDKDIITDKYNLIPDTTWWNSKEYTVKTIIKAKITKKELIYPVFSIAGAVDPLITIDGFDYDFGDMDTIKGELIEAAGKKAAVYEALYEKNFGVKLSVFGISVNDDIEECGMGYRNYSVASAKMDSGINDSAQITQLPVKKMQMRIFMRYLIER